MAIREHMILSYLVDEEVYAIIGHDFLMYLKIAAFYMTLLLVLVVIRFGVTTYITDTWYVTLAVGLVWVWIYTKGLFQILDRYLDALLITNKWLVLFRRDGIFKHKNLTMQRVSIETVSYEQNSFWDTIFKKWDITIYVEDEQHSFRNAAYPAESVAKILERKERIIGNAYVMENTIDDDSRSKYEMLVEALGEVVTEYVEKRKGV